MKERERAISNCFQAWIDKDASEFRKSFAADAIYIESWGPAYRSLDVISRWFSEWNKDNSVIKWEIKRFWHENDISICEWYFECLCGQEATGFDGISVIQFDRQNRMIYLKEFQSKTPNHYPYEEQ